MSLRWITMTALVLLGACTAQEVAPEAVTTPQGLSGKGKDKDTVCCGVFGPDAEPLLEDARENAPAELGMRLRPSVDGFVTHLRFYEGKSERSEVITSLWSADGTLLARATVADGKKEGWRSAALAQPVPLLAGAEYVVSRSSAGKHGATPLIFLLRGFGTATLTAPRHGDGGFNGVRAARGAFPTQTAHGSNYFVDVAFTPGDVRPPELRIAAPVEGATVSGVVQVTGEASDASGIDRVEVRVDDGALLSATGAEHWSFTWNSAEVPDGLHRLTVIATDPTGKQTAREVSVVTDNTPRVVYSLPLTLSAQRVASDQTVLATAGWTNEGGGVAQLAGATIGAWAPGADLSAPPTRTFSPSTGPTALGKGQQLPVAAALAFDPLDAFGEWQVAAGLQAADGSWTWSPAQTLVHVHVVALGTAIHNGRLFDAALPNYKELFLAHFDSFTPEFEMKWAQLQPQRGVFNFATADRLVAFATEHGKQVRGHTLVWHNSLPSWVSAGTWTREEAIALMEQHIATVVGRYRGVIREWDVVNEAFNDDGTWRKTFWYQAIGEEYLELAFRAAHAADPDARLYYNDFNAERIGVKSTAILNAMSDLKARGVPVHGVGFQAHVSFNFFPTRQQLADNLARFAAAGLHTQITELDVRTSTLAAPVWQRWDRQGEVYRGIAEGCQDTPGCVRVSTWGITDRITYHPANELPLPFDALDAPKPAFFALQAALGRDGVPGPVAAPAGERLAALGAAWGLKLGTVATAEAIAEDVDLRWSLMREHAVMVPGATLELATLRPAQGTFDTTAAKAAILAAKTYGLSLHGRSLVWDGALPEWVAQVPVSGREAVLREHVEQTLQSFAADVPVWDVVRGAFANDGSLRPTVWSEAMGAGYVAQAFSWAHAAAPGARLLYADTGIETLNPKSDAVYALVKGLLEAGVPVHGVDFVMHRGPGTLDARSFADNLARFAALGLELHLTDLEIPLDPALGFDAALARQASIYRTVIDTVLQQPAVKTLATRGHTDAWTWSEAVAPLPLDASYAAKPAYRALQAGLTDGPFSGHYRFLAKGSQKVMAVAAAALNNGARIVQQTDTGVDSQRWAIAHLGGGRYHLVNKASGRAVKTLNGSTASGALLEQYDRVDFASLIWRPVYVGGGYHQLVSPIHGLNIRVAAGSTAENAPLDQAAYTGADNHKWMIQARN